MHCEFSDVIRYWERAADIVLDSRTKGLTHSATDTALAEIKAQRWNILAEHLPLPVAVLRRSALSNNRRWMREFLARTGARLAPHGKTSMSPELFHMQIEDGAWAITLATAQQVHVARRAGIKRILLANEMVGPRDIEYVVLELKADPSFEFFCLVDSLAGVERLAATARAARLERPVQLLLEMGSAGGRAGCRSIASALQVAQGIQAAQPHVSLVGVEGFEGLHQYLSAAEALPKVRSLLESIVQVAEQLDAADFFGENDIILSAGGSAYYDVVVDVFSSARTRRRTSTVLRSGCYLTHDAGSYGKLFADTLERSSCARDVPGAFENALEVWAYVISVPERGRAILGAGRRDFGHDAGAPVPLKQFRPGGRIEPVTLTSGFSIAVVNDQHAHMMFPDGADVAVGDMIALGISHPCTTFDKWQVLFLVNNDYDVTSAVRTFF